MRDQADELRRLVLRSAAEALAPDAPAPPLVVVSGGKGGVGATTIAVNLTVAAARQGHRAVLVDADFNQPDATTLCNLLESDTVVDVLAGRRTVHEVLQRGPAGIQVLPGAWAPEKMTDCTPLGQERMLAELRRLGAHADVVVLDAGSGPGAITNRFWQAADLLLLVTTGEPASIMDTYAAVKTLARGPGPARVRTLVNKVVSASTAAAVQTRIEQACHRFLGMRVEGASFVPLDPAVSVAAQAQRPFVLESPATDAARCVEALAERIVAEVNSSRSTRPGAGRVQDPGGAAA